ncbi:hypothetical protein QUF51_06370 [Bacillus pumilus]|nr:hypothetical protein [Bacillus pumilus]
MLDLFSDLSLHFERFFILNEYSIKIIQWCVLGLFIVFVTLPLWKKEKSRYLFYVGGVLRVVLLGGITLEMIHQTMARQYTVETFQVLTDIMQFLIYGYVLLVSLYYVISLSYLKNKGMFFAFDLSVLLLPLCQTVFIVFAETKTFYHSGDIGLVWRNLTITTLMCGFTALLLFLFFRLFWYRKWQELILFYSLISAVLLYIFYPIWKSDLQSSLKSIVIIATAAGSFMTIDLLCTLLKNKLRWRQLGTGCIAVFFLLLLNPIMNVPHTLFQFTKSELTDTFSDTYPPLTAKSAKELATKFVPADQHVHLLADDQPLIYSYVFANEQHEVMISAFIGELNRYVYRGHVKGSELTDKEYKKRTIEFFEKSGRSVDLDRIRLAIEKEDGDTSVMLLPKMSHDDEPRTLAYATWKKGTLLEAKYENTIFQLKDLDQIKLTEKEIATTIQNAYEELDLQTPAYQITSIDDFEFDWHHKVSVTTEDQSVFQFNGLTKKLLNVQLSKAILHDKKEKISDRILLKIMEDKRAEVLGESGLDNDKQIDRSSHVLNITREMDGINLSWRSDDTIPYTVPNRDRDVIYQQVLKKYKPYTIYKKQIKPVRMINKEGEIRVSWLVIIQTFGSNEREIYEVDGRTKEVHRFDR